MSRRYKGGVISATAPTTSTSAATGVWTLNQQMVAIVGSGWPLQPSYWIAALIPPDSGDGARGRSIATDSSGNVYVCGQSLVSGNNDIQIAKFNSVGIIQWQRSLGASGSSDIGHSLAVSSSGNVYICGRADVGGQATFQIAKYNTSGTIQWQRRLNGLTREEGYSVALDSSENVYVCGEDGIDVEGTFEENIQIAKYNTSGVIQWQRQLGNSVVNEYGRGIAVSSSGNIYICAEANISGNAEIIIAKYNTSGTIQWQRRLGQSGQNRGKAVAIDSSENVYVCGNSDASGTNDFQIAKYNTSGTIQWQQRLGGAGAEEGLSIAVDSSSNVYVCGSSNASGTNDFQVAKYNTSGAIQWQRRLGGSSSDVGRSVAVDSLGNIYLCGQAALTGTSSSSFLIAKLPNDGSRTGTYTVGGYSITYAASTLTDTSSSLTSATSTLTDATSTLTDEASTLTDAATTLTSSVTTI